MHIHVKYEKTGAVTIQLFCERCGNRHIWQNVTQIYE